MLPYFFLLKRVNKLFVFENCNYTQYPWVKEDLTPHNHQKRGEDVTHQYVGIDGIEDSLACGRSALVLIRRPACGGALGKEDDWVAVLLEADHGTNIRVEAGEHNLPFPRVLQDHLKEKSSDQACRNRD